MEKFSLYIHLSPRHWDKLEFNTGHCFNAKEHPSFPRDYGEIRARRLLCQPPTQSREITGTRTFDTLLEEQWRKYPALEHSPVHLNGSRTLI